jgi:hypothetical protein
MMKGSGGMFATYCSAKLGCGGGQASNGSFTPRLKAGSRSGLILKAPDIFFQAAERLSGGGENHSPSGDRATTLYPQFALREGHQPRGSAVAA